MDVDTAFGPARLTWFQGLPAEPRALMLLGHGAGGGVAAPDLLLVSHLARELEVAVGLVEQPYRVAGRRAPAPAAQLDTALADVVGAARKAVPGTALILGGRSSGARVACRTAKALDARGVLALAFPLQPPRPPERPAPSRLPELMGAAVPALVVQGERDTFGSAADLKAAVETARRVSDGAAEITILAAVGADHSLRKGVDAAAISEWLAHFLR